MKKTKNKDFMLTDHTTKVLISVATPLIISNIITVLYDIADGLWLAQLSANAFTATGIVSSVIFLFSSASIGLSIGGTTLISHSLGAGNKERASKYAKHLLLFGLIIGTIFSVFGYVFSPQIVTLLGPRDELWDASYQYLSIMTLGFVLDALTFMFQAILNAQGQTGKTTLIGLTSGILNIFLDPIFIFKTVPVVGIPGLNYGVSGAAIATVISKFIAVLVGLVFIYSKNSQVDVSFKNFHYDKKYIKRITQMAIPTSIARSTTALGFIICNSFIIGLGDDVIAAFTLVNRINTLFMQVSMGLGAAMTAIIGQNYGARLIKRIKWFIRDGFILSIGFSLFGALIMYLFNTEIFGLIINVNENPQIIKYAIEYADYAIVNIPAMGVFFIYLAIFQGLGYMKMGLNFSLIRLWLLRLPLLLFMIYLTPLSQVGVWLSMALSNSLVLIYGQYHYRNNEVLKSA